MRQPTIKDVAAATGLSVATVSLALRRSPKIRSQTAERVRRIAEELGYTSSPLVSALMARVRSSRPVFEHTAIAILKVVSPESVAPMTPFYLGVVEGIRLAAVQLGFTPEVFDVSRKGLSVARVNSIIASRGITAAIIPPLVGPISQLDLDYASLSVVAVGYSLQIPLNRISADHSQIMMMALDRLHALGYCRIGLAIDPLIDERVLHKWSSLIHWRNAQPNVQAVPVLRDAGRTAGPLLDWIASHRPEVVVSPCVEHLRIMRDKGWRVPQQIGFCLLNHVDAGEPVSGVDQQPGELGAAAVDTLVSQLYRNERGNPTVPKTVLIGGRWVDGPTTHQISRAYPMASNDA